MTRTCARCPREIPSTKRADAIYCSAACLARAGVIRNNPVRRARYAEDAAYRERVKRASRDARRLAVTGLTAPEVDALLEAQGQRCAICSTHAKEQRSGLHLDHDHLTGKVRALLCANCNRALGLLRDDPELIRKAADYIEASRK